jgi:hypothetical protein
MSANRYFHKALAGLSAAEAREVPKPADAHARMLSGNGLDRVGKGASSARDSSITDDWLFFGISAYLKKSGQLSGSQSAVYLLEKRKGYKTYREKRPSLDAYFADIDKQLTTVSAHKIRLAILCADALADLLTKRGVFSVNAMLTQIDKIPEALERMFPGYLRAGLMAFILEQEEASNGR